TIRSQLPARMQSQLSLMLKSRSPRRINRKPNGTRCPLLRDPPNAGIKGPNLAANGVGKTLRPGSEVQPRYFGSQDQSDMPAPVLPFLPSYSALAHIRDYKSDRWGYTQRKVRSSILLG